MGMNQEIKTEHPASFYTESFVKNCIALLSSYLWLGDLPSIKAYMSLVGSILKVKPNLFKTLSEREKGYLTLIGTSLKAGFTPNPWGLAKIPGIEETQEFKAINICFDFNKEEEKDFKLEFEKDLQKILYSTYESIEFLTGDKSKLIIQVESDTKYGRMDIQARGKNICHIIELKLKNADHKIVGQVMKYARAAGSKLHYGLYEDINLITVAESYDESTILDLKTIGVKIFKYRIDQDKIIFSLV